MLTRAFELLDLLENTSGSNAKKELIQTGSDNECFKKLLYLAYNPFLKYNLVKYGDIHPEGQRETTAELLDEFEVLLLRLNSRAYSGNEAIQQVTEFFTSLTEDAYKWFSRTLLKDLRIGVTASTVNKVWKNHVPSFECALAKPFEKVKRKPELVLVEPKLDGYRAICFVTESGEVEIYTRNGKRIEGFTDVERELALFPKGNMYDGELIGKENAFNDIQKLAMRKNETDKQATLSVFDIVPLDEFRNGKSSMKLPERRANMEKIFEETLSENEVEHICLVEASDPLPITAKEIDELYEKYLDMGYEGVMLKDVDSYYECRRTNAWLKLKPFDTFDLKVIGYEEGTGKNVGKLGALIVEFKGFPVNVGTGFSDELRESLWETRENLIGETVEVNAQESTENQKGEQSLRFPVFIRFRYDK